MTPDELHDTRAFCGVCANCGGDLWANDATVTTWGGDEPTRTHKTCEEAGGNANQ